MRAALTRFTNSLTAARQTQSCDSHADCQAALVSAVPALRRINPCSRIGIVSLLCSACLSCRMIARGCHRDLSASLPAVSQLLAVILHGRDSYMRETRLHGRRRHMDKLSQEMWRGASG